jgi:acetyltransferase
MVPLSREKALHMLSDLKSFPILKGIRGQKGINLDAFAEVIVHISHLLQIAPEITELDINPLLAYENEITAVDVRIAIEK